jgi:hypothetical protein
VAVNEALTMRRFQFDEPEDDGAPALAGPPHGPQAVENGRLDVDEASVVLTKDGPQRRILGQRRADKRGLGQRLLSQRWVVDESRSR